MICYSWTLDLVVPKGFAESQIERVPPCEILQKTLILEDFEESELRQTPFWDDCGPVSPCQCHLERTLLW